MRSLGRVLAAFVLMVVAGYIGVVALLPAPGGETLAPSLVSAPSAAARLSQEARALVSRRADPSVVQ